MELDVRMSVTLEAAQTEADNRDVEGLEVENDQAINEEDLRETERAMIDQIKAELSVDLREEEKMGNRISDELYERLQIFSQSYSFDFTDGPFWATLNHRMKAARRENLIPKGLENTSAGERYMANFKAFVALFLEALSDIVLSVALLKKQGGLLALLALVTGLLSVPPIMYGFFSTTHGFSRFAMVTATPVFAAVLATDISDGLYLLAVRGDPLALGDYLAFTLPVLLPVVEMLITCLFPRMYNTCSQALLIQSVTSPLVAFLYGLVFLLDRTLDIDIKVGNIGNYVAGNKTTTSPFWVTGTFLVDFVVFYFSAIYWMFAWGLGWQAAARITNQEEVADFKPRGWLKNSYKLVIFFIVPTIPMIYEGNLRGIIFLGVLLTRTIGAFWFITYYLKLKVLYTSPY